MGEIDCPRGCVTLCAARVIEGEDAPCDRELIRLETRERVVPAQRPTERAAALVDGDRQDAYGHPLENHERIAAFWTVRLVDKLRPGCVVEPHEAAALMRLAKEARLMQTAGHADSLVDLAGYSDVEWAIHEGYKTRPITALARRFGFTRGR